MQRIGLIDGMRGHLLLSMMIIHLCGEGAYHLGFVHHQALIGLWDGEFFVLISGFVVGTLSLRKLEFGHRFRAFIWDRIKRIYLFLMVVNIAAFVAFPDAFAWRWDVVIGALLLEDGSGLAGLLNMYIFCFVWLALISLMSQRGAVILGLSVGLYLLSFLTVQGGFFGLGDATDVYFDFAAWQLILVVGFLVGRNQETIGLALFQRGSKLGLAAFMVALAIWCITRSIPPFPELFSNNFTHERWMVRHQLGPQYLLEVLSFSYIAVYALISGYLPRAIQGAFNWYFNLGVLRRLGRVSLEMYAWHAIMIFAYILLTDGFSNIQKSIMGVAFVIFYVISPIGLEFVRALQKKRLTALRN